MGIRQVMNEKPALVIAGVVAVILGVGVFVWQGTSSGAISPDRIQGYYSDDDGKTYFADAFPKPVPFDHGGRKAYRARVYRIGGGTPSVAWLESFPEDLNQALGGQSDVQARMALFQSFSDRMMVKRAGDPAWVSLNGSPAETSRKGAADYRTITTPTGGDAAVEVLPNSP